MHTWERWKIKHPVALTPGSLSWVSLSPESHYFINVSLLLALTDAFIRELLPTKLSASARQEDSITNWGVNFSCQVQSNLKMKIKHL